eukprot:TRINITY_DN16245_c0_g1_i2.p2 TRINITY_DN16245_c0_g1~~TRINITY_DN16245_c0_g1_i2.p2  ORF type:complete len:141 (-),score=24.65 TRINITY_DN16245_c0_g1_i2:60-482(-)
MCIRDSINAEYGTQPAMSYTAKHAFRVREQDAGRPAPHNRQSTYSHNQYDSVSNMSHYRIGDIRPGHKAPLELSNHQAGYQPASIRNLGETNAPHDSYAESDPRNDSFSALHRLLNNDPTLLSLTPVSYTHLTLPTKRIV